MHPSLACSSNEKTILLGLLSLPFDSCIRNEGNNFHWDKKAWTTIKYIVGCCLHFTYISVAVGEISHPLRKKVPGSHESLRLLMLFFPTILCPLGLQELWPPKFGSLMSVYLCVPFIYNKSTAEQNKVRLLVWIPLQILHCVVPNCTVSCALGFAEMVPLGVTRIFAVYV